MSEPHSEHDRILRRMTSLVSRYHQREMAYDLESVAKYYAYLADQIDYDNLHVNTSQAMLETFESVFLWLSDALLQYPDTIRSQVLGIVRDNQICEVIGIIANLSETHLQRLRRRKIFNRLPRLYSLLGFHFLLPGDEHEYVTPKKLFDVKMAMKRLSQILKFASSVDVLDYDESFRDFRNNYDPNLIDKNKLLALTHVLRVQLHGIHNNEHVQLVLRRLDSIESELKKSTVRWGVVITGFFVLLGFFADLQTLCPGIYDRPAQTVRQILDVLQHDATVQRHGRLALGTEPTEDPHNHDPNAPPKPAAVIGSEPRVTRENDCEIDDQDSDG